MLTLVCHWCSETFKTKKVQRMCPTCKLLKAQCKWDELEKRNSRNP